MHTNKRIQITSTLFMLFNVAIVEAVLNDTGITFCSDATHNNLPCPVVEFVGQDAQYGTNGFNFTKLSVTGAEMPATATDHACVRDNVTGLIWEVKSDDGGLRDKDWSYSWNFTPESSGGHSGVPNGGNCGHRGYCDTEKYAQDVNAMNLCGFDDWRIPAVKELTSIVDYGIYYGPPIFTSFFPNTRANWYWTSTPAIYGSGSAWAVIFFHGKINHAARANAYAVRLVRGAELLSNDFVDNGDGTITDSATSLMWAKCSIGLEGRDCAIGRINPLNWEEALDTARNFRLANYVDWRLPNVKELQSLVDYEVYNPSINTTFFPNTASRLYWSASPYAFAASVPSYSWPVNFNYGYVDVEDDDRMDQRIVRLVRDAHPPAYTGQFTRNSQSLVALPPTSAVVNQDWNFIGAATGFNNVIVLAGVPSYNEVDPGVARLRNIGERGFAMRFQEWEYRAFDFDDTQHKNEDIPYVVLIRGRQQLPDGSTWEVGTFPVARAGVWEKIPFIGVFNNPPHLFLTVQTVNDSDAVIARARNIGNGDFEVALFEEEALMDGIALETVGYLAIENPNISGLKPGREAIAPYPYLLQNFWADQRWVPVLSQRIKVEEERSVDDEIEHPDEMIHALAFGQQLFAQQVSHNDTDTTALRRWPPVSNVPMEWGIVRGISHNWQIMPFTKSYENPVLVISPISMLGEGPGVIRMRNLNGNYTAIRYQEWDYLDGIHDVAESAFYMLVEAGQYVLGNPDIGLTVEARRLETNRLARNERWNEIEFAAEFDIPAVFASVLTSNSSDDINQVNNAVTTRIANVKRDGFEIAMDEQESLMDNHVTEALGWIAFESGGAITVDGRIVDVFFRTVDHSIHDFYYPLYTEQRFPTVLGQVNTARDLDPITLQYINPTGDSVGLRLVEEQSYDEELEHEPERIGILIGE